MNARKRRTKSYLSQAPSCYMPMFTMSFALPTNFYRIIKTGTYWSDSDTRDIFQSAKNPCAYCHDSNLRDCLVHSGLSRTKSRDEETGTFAYGQPRCTTCPHTKAFQTVKTSVGQLTMLHSYTCMTGNIVYIAIWNETEMETITIINQVNITMAYYWRPWNLFPHHCSPNLTLPIFLPLR